MRKTGEYGYGCVAHGLFAGAPVDVPRQSLYVLFEPAAVLAGCELPLAEIGIFLAGIGIEEEKTA